MSLDLSLDETELLLRRIEDQMAVDEYPNPSGLSPLGHAVLVRTYEPEIRSGLIQIPDHVKSQMQSVEQRCVVVAVGPHAWKDEDSPRAIPGDRVLVTKYAGWVTNQTKDGQTYRLVNDRDIFCRIDFNEGDSK